MITASFRNSCYDHPDFGWDQALAKPIRELFVFNLKRLMAERDIKPGQLAKRVGVNASAVTHWVKGEQPPTLDNLGKIADILQIPVSSLFHDPADPRVTGMSREATLQALLQLVTEVVTEKLT